MIRNKEYKQLGIKNYNDIILDGRIKRGINKKLKKQCRRIARKRLKRKSD